MSAGKGDTPRPPNPDKDFHTGSWTVGSRVIEVWSTLRPPRMPGDGCGCTRRVDDGGLMSRYVLTLCAKHSKEPGIRTFCLDH